jgi:hypothetical protein
MGVVEKTSVCGEGGLWYVRNVSLRNTRESLESSSSPSSSPEPYRPDNSHILSSSIPRPRPRPRPRGSRFGLGCVCVCVRSGPGPGVAGDDVETSVSRDVSNDGGVPGASAIVSPLYWYWGGDSDLGWMDMDNGGVRGP